MTEPIRFTKMHGAGNDYIYVNTMAFPVRNPEELAIRLSAPHTGIGSEMTMSMSTVWKRRLKIREKLPERSATATLGSARTDWF